MDTGSKLLVTGGCGFVMSQVVYQWLVSNAANTCVILDLVYDDKTRQFFAPYTNRIFFVKGSVTNVNVWNDLLVAHKDISYIVHGATITPTSEEEKKYPGRILSVNIMGTVHCLDFFSRLKSQQRMIYVSSGAVYSEDSPLLTQNPLKEDGPTMPQEMYSISKFSSEHIVRRYNELFGLNVISVRFSDVYGVMDRDTGARNRHNLPYYICNKIARSKQKQTQIIVKGTMDDAGGDFICVIDVGRAILKILIHPYNCKNHIYNIAYGEWISVKQLITQAGGKAILAQPASKMYDVKGLSGRHKYGRHGAYSIDSLKTEFNWNPTNLNQALTRYTTWLTKQIAKPAKAKM